MSATRSEGQAAKRLQKELMDLMMNANSSDLISAFPEDDNLFSWRASLVGAKDTPYDGLHYDLQLTFPADYPIKAPTVKFLTACYHPNVDDHGNICLDILQDNWAASLEIRTVLLSVQAMLGDPNNDSPLNEHAAHLWSHRDEFVARVKATYEEHKRRKCA
eukprot:TRINITY_DN131_c0_g2_i1.p1 TRINITY_DN131_c0_g2~~TRINITY_DN131_c0_g2_i1.p1  ORF type:complete len:161 (+),score=34.95 TRINITY_DN131_c0_g2_i1:97-579(+)